MLLNAQMTRTILYNTHSLSSLSFVGSSYELLLPHGINTCLVLLRKRGDRSSLERDSIVRTKAHPQLFSCSVQVEKAKKIQKKTKTAKTYLVFLLSHRCLLILLECNILLEVPTSLCKLRNLTIEAVKTCHGVRQQNELYSGVFQSQTKQSISSRSCLSCPYQELSCLYGRARLLDTAGPRWNVSQV